MMDGKWCLEYYYVGENDYGPPGKQHILLSSETVDGALPEARMMWDTVKSSRARIPELVYRIKL